MDEILEDKASEKKKRKRGKSSQPQQTKKVQSIPVEDELLRFDTSTKAGKKKNVPRYTIRSLDLEMLYAVVSSFEKAVELIPSTKPQTAKAAHTNGTGLVVGRGRRAGSKAICRIVDAQPGEVLGVTTAGETFFASNAVQFPVSMNYIVLLYVLFNANI